MKLREARALGVARFHTGKPCRNGHWSERRAHDGRCVLCMRAKDARKRERDRLNLPPRVQRRRGGTLRLDGALRWCYVCRLYRAWIDFYNQRKSECKACCRGRCREYGAASRARGAEWYMRNAAKLKRDRDNLEDWYVRTLVCAGTDLKPDDIPDALVDAWRTRVIAHRLVRANRRRM